MKRRFLLDANHMSAAIHPVSPLRDRLRHAHRSGLILGTCVPVLCELEAGIQQTDDPEGCRRALGNLLGFVRLWPLEVTLARRFGEIFCDVRRRGRAMAQVNMILAALVREMNLTLLTSDNDFIALPDVRTENWLVAAVH
jgi:predicted nucleic acid-binding protein